MKLFFKVIILFLQFFVFANAQTLNDSSQSNYLEMRYGDVLRNETGINFFSATRFMLILSANPIGNWTSPSSSISINGNSFNSFPLNFNTLDLLPIDILQSDSIEISNHPTLGNDAAIGKINFVTKPIDNSFRIRGFLGSETGDPLIHTFTRNPSESLENKNKIAPSGVISYSNKNSIINYRLTLGYFGYFSTGSGNDATIRQLNPYFSKKQNKQILGTAELEYPFGKNKKLSLYSSFITYYGWDVPPFLTTFAHFETFTHTIRLKAENLFDNFSFSLMRDGSLTEVNGTTAFFPAKFSLSEFSFLPEWQKKLSKKYKIKVFSKITNQSSSNLSDELNSKSQKFFNSKINKWNFGIGINNKYNFTNNFVGELNLRFDKHFIDKSFSNEFNLLNTFSGGTQIKYTASSVTQYPNLTELYGNFLFDSVNGKKFNIKGNEKLKYQRVNHFGIELNKSFLEDKLFFSVNIFNENIENPIQQKTLASARFNSFSNILRDAFYINGDKKKLWGINLSTIYSPVSFINILSNYSFTDNSEVLYRPKNKIHIKTILTFPFKGTISAEFQYRSKSFFEKYKIATVDDHFLNSGFNGEIPEINIFNVSFQQELINFYFAREFIFDISIKNIFNRTNKYLPIGNNLDRAVIISIFSSI